ncbi:MAG: TonB-dependent receptor [Sphingomicrobium sp.]
MNRQFRQRLLTSTLFVGVSLIAAPAYAQYPAQTPSPPDNSATPQNPETTTPPEGQTTIPSTSAEGETVETTSDIIITGSRIPQPNLTSASPVTVLTAQEVKLQGTTRTEDLINSLPQAFAAQGSNISNGATGTATVNLRGLGSSRTLVLVNGRRLMPGDPRSPVPDLNFIPAPLIKRVDVLTGGASSVYGADAVSGVVNFIIDTNFRGLRIDAQSSVFMHENGTKSDIIEANEARGFRPPTGYSVNGGAQDIALAFGAGFDDNRGNITTYATYRRQRPVLQSTRDYSFCALAALPQSAPRANNDIDELDRRFNCGGSATSANGTFFTNVGTFQVEGDQFVAGNTPFNFGPFNFFQRPDERYTLGGFAEYEISEGFKPYLEAMFMDDRSLAQIAPSGNFFATDSINCDNPLLSAQQSGIICQGAVFDPTDATVTDGDFNSNFGNLVGQSPIFGDDPDGDGPLEAPLIGFTDPTTFTGPTGDFLRGIAYTGRRNVEGGGRQDDLRHTAYRLVGGIRGDFSRGLSYDAYYQYGTTLLSQVYLNDFSIRRLTQASDAVTDPATGLPVCRGTLTGTADAGCVPFNIFSEGGVTQDQLNFLQTPGFANGNVRESVANFNVTLQGAEYGLQLPWANRGIGVNVGGEYRKESLDFDTDTAFSTGDLAGQGGPTIGVSGDFDVRELFTEVELPIVNDSFFHEFSIQAGYRYSDYKVGGGGNFDTHTYKLAAELAPVRDVRLRASYNRAVRAPNVVELFSAQSIGLGLNADPCAGEAEGGLVNGLTQAQCALTGVSAAQFGRIRDNPANQFNSFGGGNPDLEPEKADSYTAGIVLQPRFIPGLAVTVDYFDIRLKNAIGVIGADTIVSQCLATGDPFFCDRINRAPGSGSLFLGDNGFVTDINTNVGGVSTKGVDVNASYARQIGRLGSLNLSLVGTYLDELVSNPVADTKFDCAGFFGTQCGTPNPEWRHKFRAGFTLPNGIGFSGQWRHFSRVKIDALSNDTDLCPTTGTGDGLTCNPNSTSPSLFPANRRLKAMNYFDIAMQARVSDRFNFRIGANNVFDTEPPIAGSQVIGAGSGNGNTYPQVYDSLGRYLFAGITVDY